MPRLLPKRLMMLVAVVMNAVIVAEAASAKSAPSKEKNRLLYIIAVDAGKRKPRREPIMMAPLPRRLMM